MFFFLFAVVNILSHNFTDQVNNFTADNHIIQNWF